MDEVQMIEGVEMVSISKADLARVLTQWESEARTGEWAARPDLSCEQLGADNAEYLWPKLSAVSEKIDDTLQESLPLAAG